MVINKSDKRRNDYRQAILENCRQLIAKAFTGAGRHGNKYIVRTFNNTTDGVFLQLAFKLLMMEDIAQCTKNLIGAFHAKR